MEACESNVILDAYQFQLKGNRGEIFKKKSLISKNFSAGRQTFSIAYAFRGICKWGTFGDVIRLVSTTVFGLRGVATSRVVSRL